MSVVYAEPDPTAELAAALARFTLTKGCPEYLRATYATWEASRA